jgi:hypothetical protein
MFRIFLKKKLLDGDGVNTPSNTAGLVKPQRRNRRVFERYAVDHKHLTLMNEQDILLVKEISAKGFSTDVSERTVQRLTVGDVYAARVRYLGETYDLDAKVSWKSGQQIGFEIIKAGRETMQFLRRLLLPIEIASSLQEVNSSFMINNNENKNWFHGDMGTDLYLWKDDEEQLIAWQLVHNNKFIEWQSSSGLRSGSIVAPTSSQLMFGGGGVYGTVDQKDPTVDLHLKQLATDVFIALHDKFHESAHHQLIESITKVETTKE